MGNDPGRVFGQGHVPSRTGQAARLPAGRRCDSPHFPNGTVTTRSRGIRLPGQRHPGAGPARSSGASPRTKQCRTWAGGTQTDPPPADPGRSQPDARGAGVARGDCPPAPRRPVPEAARGNVHLPDPRTPGLPTPAPGLRTAPPRPFNHLPSERPAMGLWLPQARAAQPARSTEEPCAPESRGHPSPGGHSLWPLR